MGDSIELREMDCRPKIIRGKTRIPRPISESGIERRSSRYSRHLSGGSSSQATISRGRRTSNSMDLDRIEVESEINGDSASRAEISADPDYDRWALECYSKHISFIVDAYNLGFFYFLVPFYVGIKDGCYELRQYLCQIVPYVLAVITTTIHLLLHFIYKYGTVDMDKKPESGYETATDFIYILCLLGHLWMLVGVRKHFQSFVQKFAVNDEEGFSSKCAKLIPLALLLLIGCTYSKIGEALRKNASMELLSETYETERKMMFYTPICSRLPFAKCKTIVPSIHLVIQILVEIQKYVLEIQMLTSAIFIRMVANELEKQCLGFSDMSNSNIIKAKHLFSVARRLVGDLNRWNWSLSIFYFAQLFPFLIVSIFHIVTKDWPWVANNGLLLILKLSVPLLSSSGTRKFGNMYSNIRDMLGYHHRDTEGLLDPLERTERRSYREGLINDFENAAKEPITLQCLGYYSVNEKWIVVLVGAVYGTCCYVLDLSLGIRRGVSAAEDANKGF